MRAGARSKNIDPNCIRCGKEEMTFISSLSVSLLKLYGLHPLSDLELKVYIIGKMLKFMTYFIIHFLQEKRCNTNCFQHPLEHMEGQK
jgi:hypothetical protein